MASMSDRNPNDNLVDLTSLRAEKGLDFGPGFFTPPSEVPVLYDQESAPEPKRKNLRLIGAIGGVVLAMTVAHLVDKRGEELDWTGGNGSKEYEVKPNDTLSQIAENAFPNEDPRSVVHELAKQLPDDEAHKDGLLQPGDMLVLAPGSQIGEPIEQEQQP